MTQLIAIKSSFIDKIHLMFWNVLGHYWMKYWSFWSNFNYHFKFTLILAPCLNPIGGTIITYMLLQCPLLDLTRCQNQGKFKMIIKIAPKAPISSNNGLKHSKTSNGFYQ